MKESNKKQPTTPETKFVKIFENAGNRVSIERNREMSDRDAHLVQITPKRTYFFKRETPLTNNSKVTSIRQPLEHPHNNKPIETPTRRKRDQDRGDCGNHSASQKN
jgi:hypothetical protein